MIRITEEQKNELEVIIDLEGLDEVIKTLIEICEEKAMHVEEQWGDKKIAKAWQANAKNLDKVLAKYSPTY